MEWQECKIKPKNLKVFLEFPCLNRHFTTKWVTYQRITLILKGGSVNKTKIKLRFLGNFYLNFNFWQ